MAAEGRVGEVLARLALVVDPELDKPVTDLGFVTDVAIDAADQVRVGFRLPTYWCAANFSFLMADDMRREILALSWVRSVHVELGEHMYAETINRAMRQGLSFQEAFGHEADGDLEALRRTFELKAFSTRQSALLDHLLPSFPAESLLALSIGGLRALPATAEGRRLIARYLHRRPVAGPAGPEQPAFVDETGSTVTVARFSAHRRALRGTAVNVEFNGALCRGLLAARFSEGEHALPVEPTLLDFVRAVRPGAPPLDPAKGSPLESVL